MDIDSKPVTATYALGDDYIHGQISDQGLTLCGQWVSDIKPLAAGRAFTCSDCSTARTLREHFQAYAADATSANLVEPLRALSEALRAGGIPVTDGPA